MYIQASKEWHVIKFSNVTYLKFSAVYWFPYQFIYFVIKNFGWVSSYMPCGFNSLIKKVFGMYCTCFIQLESCHSDVNNNFAKTFPSNFAKTEAASKKNKQKNN